MLQTHCTLIATGLASLSSYVYKQMSINNCGIETLQFMQLSNNVSVPYIVLFQFHRQNLLPDVPVDNATRSEKNKNNDFYESLIRLVELLLHDYCMG